MTPLNFLDPGKPGNIDFLQIGSGLSLVLIMSRDAAGGEHGPRRERYTEVWLLWDHMYADTGCVLCKAGSQRSHIGPQLYFVLLFS